MPPNAILQKKLFYLNKFRFTRCDYKIAGVIPFKKDTPGIPVQLNFFGLAAYIQI